MVWVGSFLKNFQKGQGGYHNSEVLVILYVDFLATELHPYTLIPFSSSIFSPKKNIILKDVAVFNEIRYFKTLMKKVPKLLPLGLPLVFGSVVWNRENALSALSLSLSIYIFLKTLGMYYMRTWEKLKFGTVTVASRG